MSPAPARLVRWLVAVTLVELGLVLASITALMLSVPTPVDTWARGEAAWLLANCPADPILRADYLQRAANTLAARVTAEPRGRAAIGVAPQRMTAPTHALPSVRVTDAASPCGAITLQPLLPRPPALRPLVVVGLLLAVVLGFAALVSRRVLAPIERLSRAMGAFGAGDLSARSQERRDDELGRLAGAFDAMAGRIAALVGAKNELLGAVAHELRTPLARLRVTLDLFREGAAPDAELLAGLSADLGDLQRIVEDVLTLAREDDLAAQPQRLDRVAVDLRVVAQEAVDTVLASHPGARIEMALPERSVEVTGSPPMLRRALQNVVDNAIRHGTNVVSVSLTTTVEAASLVVRDRGPGMSAADSARAFEPFFRADVSRQRSTGGVGLGLALTRRFIDLHGGASTLESAPGLGTTVTLSLPRAHNR